MSGGGGPKKNLKESVCRIDLCLAHLSRVRLADDARKKVISCLMIQFSGGNNSCFGPIFSEESPSESVYPSFYQACIGATGSY